MNIDRVSGALVVLAVASLVVGCEPLRFAEDAAVGDADASTVDAARDAAIDDGAHDAAPADLGAPDLGTPDTGVVPDGGADRFVLTIQLGGTGHGAVAADVGALACPSECSAAYEPGARVTLTATPDGLSRFDGWVGAGCSGTSTCTVTMNRAESVTAIFTDVSVPLTVARDGTGQGAVLSNPIGIACGSTCEARFVVGASVTLVATPSAGSRFSRWSGACAGQGETCTLTLARAEQTTATFEENRVLQAALGLYHTCILLVPGVVRCFGEAADGQLGYGDATDRGDGLGPAANAADVPLALPAGVSITKITAGAFHTCVLLSNGAIRCWGQNTYGQLGYGDRATRGNTPQTTPPADVPLGGAIATDVEAGSWHTCAKLEGGTVRCWGRGTYGLLGTGNTTDQLRADGPEVTFAGTPTPHVEQLAVAAAHTCVVLDNGRVRCWGRGLFGTLGYGDQVDRGDSPASVPIAGDVPIGNVTVQRLIRGISNTCALLDTGALRCWGHNAHGQLGRGNTDQIGDDASDNLQLDVPIGAQVLAASLGTNFCAIVVGDVVRCWGENGRGQLGLGDTVNRGDGIGPDLTNTMVPLGAPAVGLDVGSGTHVCVILRSGALRCWGPNDRGQLGYGDRVQRGDGVGPGPTADVPIF